MNTESQQDELRKKIAALQSKRENQIAKSKLPPQLEESATGLPRREGLAAEVRESFWTTKERKTETMTTVTQKEIYSRVQRAGGRACGLG